MPQTLIDTGDSLDQTDRSLSSWTIFVKVIDKTALVMMLGECDVSV